MADDGPNVCVRCGLYPELFMVPDHVSQHYIAPEWQHRVIGLPADRRASGVARWRQGLM
jgi:hypothetical protein